MVTKLTNHRLRTDKCNFNYLDNGPMAEGCPVVFLHGWGLAAQVFYDGLAFLAAHRRVVAPDLPGFYQSRCATIGWEYQNYAEAILALTEALGLQEFHLAGHSTGGGIAIYLAAHWPERVRSLALVDSAGIPLQSLGRLLGRKLWEQPAQAWTTHFAPQHGRLAWAPVYSLLFQFRNAFDSLRLPLRGDLRAEMALVRAPCLIVWGEKDGTIPLAWGKQLAAHMPRAQFMLLPRAYHEWSVLQPRLFAQILTAFLQQAEGIMQV